MYIMETPSVNILWTVHLSNICANSVHLDYLLLSGLSSWTLSAFTAAMWSISKVSCLDTEQGWQFAFCSFALAVYLKSDKSKMSRSIFSFFECNSDSLFMKEQFTLFKISLCSFLKRKLTAGLITAKESKSLFLKRVTRAIFF